MSARASATSPGDALPALGLSGTLRKLRSLHHNQPADRLALAAFIAVVAHCVLILGVSFSPEDRPPSPAETLDVTIVTHRTESAPDSARYLAQANQDGGAQLPRGEEPATAPARTSLLSAVAQPAIALPAPDAPASEVPVSAAPAPPLDAPPERAAQSTPDPQRATPAPAAVARIVAVEKPKSDSAKAKPTPPVSAPKPVAESAPGPDAGAPEMSATALMRRSLAMASLSASVDDKLRAYSERPREKFITTRTREHVLAAYMESWRQKVERIGNLNYPDEARRKRLSGRLQLDVAIVADGSVKSIEVRRPSRHKVLDDAAVRIVELAAPYPRFPASVAAKVDVLHIVRTWVFSASNQFASGH